MDVVQAARRVPLEAEWGTTDITCTIILDYPHGYSRRALAGGEGG